MSMPHVRNLCINGNRNEDVIRDYITHKFGHFVVASNDRLFINVLRRTITTELGLSTSCITIVPSAEQIYKITKELSVKKKNIVAFIETSIDGKSTEDVIKKIGFNTQNCKIIVITTESEIHRLALLREQKLADNWIIKPVIINQLAKKVASVIKPNQALEKLIDGAEKLLQQGSFDHVLTICRKIFEVRPNSAVTHMLMGDAYRGLDRREDMIAAYEHACCVDEFFLEPLHRLVDFFRTNNDSQNELLYLEKLDAVSPLNSERKMDIAQLHLNLGHAEEAKGAFEAIMRTTTKRFMTEMSETAIKIGRMYAEKNDPEAEKYLRKAIEAHGNNLDKSHMHLFNSLGIFLRKTGKWQESIVEFKAAIAIDDKDDILWYNMALAYDDGGDNSNALTCIREALRINKDMYKNKSVVSMNIGMILSKAGEHEESRRYLQHALTISPENKQAQTLLASLAGKSAPAMGSLYGSPSEASASPRM